MSYEFNLLNVQAQVRSMLRDTVSVYRYSDLDLLRYIYQAQSEIMRRNPAACPPDSIVPDANNWTPVVYMTYESAIVNYAVGMALAEDGEEGALQRSAFYLQNFENIMKG